MSENIYRDAIEKPRDRVIVALDNMTWRQAQITMTDAGENVGMGKANALAQKQGWLHAVSNIMDFGARTMADAKFHDIPETVRLAVKDVTECKASLITVHASGGQAMLEHAVLGREQGKAVLREHYGDLFKGGLLGGILGITVLTSLDGDECVSIYGDEPEKKVVQFAHMALDAGIDGIVCSGKELRAIRAVSALDSLIAVVPGITPEWAKKPGDQKRVVTPREALLEGADYEVIGRAITQPPQGVSTREAAERIVAELAEAA